ncbi:MAG: type III-B CRISPR module RAMP protein Cmr6 [Fimbriimonadaceae bacterium]|nr:type III-B CRISPR module RAMP protein Cmr6 [Fimbriimonadaceae bacterium]
MRTALNGLDCKHPGLLFQTVPQALPARGDKRAWEAAKAAWRERCRAASTASGVYRDHRDRMEGALGTGRVFECAGRLVVGLGNGHLFERGFALHGLFGTPVIHGAALKGPMLREALLQTGLLAEADRIARDPTHPIYPIAWERLADAVPSVAGTIGGLAWLFGDAEGAGALTVFDALWEPNGQFFAADVTTPHNGPYYQANGGRPWPDDTAAPDPLSSFSLPRGARFRFWLRTGDAGADDQAWALLESALANLGVGARTSSGYGRMLPVVPGTGGRPAPLGAANLPASSGPAPRGGHAAPEHRPDPISSASPEPTATAGRVFRRNMAWAFEADGGDAATPIDIPDKEALGFPAGGRRARVRQRGNRFVFIEFLE